jgi:ELWxxDGT repeat protein
MEPNATVSTATQANLSAANVDELSFSGARLVKDINPGRPFGLSYRASDFTEFDGKLFFTARDGTTGRELWVSDGTTEGTQLLKDISPFTGSPYKFPEQQFIYPSNLTVAGGKLFFTANDSITGTELWVSDGTAEGTQLLKDINPGSSPYGSPYSSSASNFTEVEGKLFFIANDGTTGGELWVSDGTTEGTQLLIDINPGNASSNASGFTEFNGKLFFIANDGVTGTELWVSDGTAEGTQLLKDINPGSSPYGSPYSSSASNFTEVEGKLFFTANDGVTGTELWVSDGTAEGTQLLKDINPGSSPYGSPYSSSASNFTEVDGKLFFTANDGVTGTELWVSDGTAEGTQLLKDINPGSSPYGSPYSSSASNFTEVEGKLFFTANDGVTGTELWVSDGTAEGTQLLKDIRPGNDTDGYPASSFPFNFIEFDGKLFFTAFDSATGTELWVSDGTAEGTQLLKDINPGIDPYYDGYPASSSPSNLTVAGDLLFFTADDGTTGRELWISDGTAEGTQFFQNINPGFVDGSFQPNLSSDPSNLSIVGDQLFFSANDGVNGSELWVASIPDNVISGDANNNVLNGTDDADFISGLDGNDVIRGRGDNDIINGGNGDDVLFGNSGNDLLNGGAGNDNLNGGAGDDTVISNFIGIDAADGGAGHDSIRFEFAPGESRNLTIDLNLGTASNGQGASQTLKNFEAITVTGDGNNRLLGNGRANQLDGGAGNDELFGNGGQDVLAGGSGRDTLIGGRGDDTLIDGLGSDVLIGDGGADIFRFGGNVLNVDRFRPEGDTNIIQDFQAQDALDFSGYLSAGGSIAATRLTSGLLRLELRDDNVVGVVNVFGNTAGLDAAEAQLSAILAQPLVKNFKTSPIEANTTLSTATQANLSAANVGELSFGGAQLVRDIRPGINPSSPSNLAVVGDLLFFGAGDSTTGGELWVSDGTAEGTQRLKDINPGRANGVPTSSYPSNLTEVDGKLFFTANDGITGDELWVSDGTAEGTQLLKDINPSSNPGSNFNPLSPSNLTEFEGKLFFTADDGAIGRELWVSDGTAEGTQLLIDINPGTAPSDAFNFTEVEGKLFFSADDGATGRELWVSDGTAEGTQLLIDINPGSSPSGFPYSSNASNFTEVDGKLFFTADDGTTGSELWVSDGTAEGTQLLIDINPGSNPYFGFPYSSNASNFTEVDGKLFFTADDGTTGSELWVSNGTAEGTQLLKDINPGANYYGLPVSSGAHDFTELDGKLFFTANDGATGRELWVSDGTAEGTQLLKDINPGGFNGSPYSSDASNLTIAGDLLFFTADDDVTGTELWVSDGTAEGTQLFQNINPGFLVNDSTRLNLSSDPRNLSVVGDQLFFTADDGVNGRELWVAAIPDNVIAGDANNNVLNGTGNADFISGLDGNDVIRGRGDNDVINGGNGNDVLFGDSGNDILNGGAGNDNLNGGAGDDTVISNFVGIDAADGGVGHDLIRFEVALEFPTNRSRNLTIDMNLGTASDGQGVSQTFKNFEAITVIGDGNNRLLGNGRANQLNGGSGNDELFGNGGQDGLTGGSGRDTLIGGQGNDTLAGGTGSDVLIGDSGADTFRFDGDVINSTGNTDTDTIQDFQVQDAFDFSGYLSAGGSIAATRLTSGLLRLELSSSDVVDVVDVVNVFGNTAGLDAAEAQLAPILAT